MRRFAPLLLLVAAVALVVAGGRLTAVPAPPSGGDGDCVVLLHGLGRSAASMEPMAQALRADGYHVVNVDYPSTRFAVDTLVMRHVGPAVRGGCRPDASPSRRIHFVTHSMGGILARAYAAEAPGAEGGAPLNLGRVVMLAPPNGGSEVAEALKDWWLFQAVNGPAGAELGLTESTPRALGPVTVEVGVLAGDRSLDPWFAPLFDGPHDGKVAVERARVAGMADFRVVPSSHAFIMRHPTVIAETRHFLEHGRFRPAPGDALAAGEAE